MSNAATQAGRVLTLTNAIVSAYVGRHHVRRDELPEVLRTVHEALTRLGETSLAAPDTHKTTPAEIKRSITADHLISFEDGKPYQTLRRHLASRGLTPEAYRAKWGLPSDYPMTAPNYSARRSDLARASQLGRRPRARDMDVAVDDGGSILPAHDPAATPDELYRLSSSSPDEDPQRDDTVEMITREPYEEDGPDAEAE